MASRVFWRLFAKINVSVDGIETTRKLISLTHITAGVNISDDLNIANSFLKAYWKKKTPDLTCNETQYSFISLPYTKAENRRIICINLYAEGGKSSWRCQKVLAK